MKSRPLQKRTHSHTHTIGFVYVLRCDVITAGVESKGPHMHKHINSSLSIIIAALGSRCEEATFLSTTYARSASKRLYLSDGDDVMGYQP